MSLIEYNVSKEQIVKGESQLAVVNPSYNYKTDSLLGKVANQTNVVFAFIMGLIDVATLGLFEGINYAIFRSSQSTYEQLCDDFAKRQLEIDDRIASKDLSGSIFKKSVRELANTNNGVFTQLRSRITKAGNVATADADAIKTAAQYKLQEAIYKANKLLNEDKSFDESNDDVNKFAKERSDKLITNTKDSEMRAGVAGLISGGLGSIDAEAIKDLASESGKSDEDVEREVGKQLRGRYVKDREFEKATRAKPADFRKQVENDIKKATAKMKTEVAARQKAIGELYKLEKESEKLEEQYQDIEADLGNEESIEDGAATGYYLQRDTAQKTLDNDNIKGRKRTQAENSKKEADEKIQELEKKKADVESNVTKYIANKKKQEDALAKAEGNYHKLVRTHFGITVSKDDGSVTSPRIRDDKVAKAILQAGTRDEAEETEEGKLKFHALPTDLSKHFDKAGLIRKAQAAHKPKIDNLAKLRQEEIDRRAAEKASGKSDELDATKKRELRYLGKEMAKANKKLLERLVDGRGEGRKAHDSDGGTSATSSDNDGEPVHEEEDRPIRLEEEEDDVRVDDAGHGDNIDGEEEAPKAELSKKQPNRRADLAKWKRKMAVKPDDEAPDGGN